MRQIYQPRSRRRGACGRIGPAGRLFLDEARRLHRSRVASHKLVQNPVERRALCAATPKERRHASSDRPGLRVRAGRLLRQPEARRGRGTLQDRPGRAIAVRRGPDGLLAPGADAGAAAAAVPSQRRCVDLAGAAPGPGRRKGRGRPSKRGRLPICVKRSGSHGDGRGKRAPGGKPLARGRDAAGRHGVCGCSCAVGRDHRCGAAAGAGRRARPAGLAAVAAGRARALGAGDDGGGMASAALKTARAAG